MAKAKDFIKNIQEWLKIFVELGFSFILILVVIDILFPGVTAIIENLQSIIGSFSSEGAVGLIALFIFLLIYKR